MSGSLVALGSRQEAAGVHMVSGERSEVCVVASEKESYEEG